MVMNKKINAAADSGIDAFVFDWYWYDGPYLERALDEGFLNAPDRSRIKFALMWANHDWMDRHPINFANSFNAPLVYPWTSTCKSISFVWEYIIENYAIALAKESELTEKINAALEALIADGSVGAVIEKYIPAE